MKSWAIANARSNPGFLGEVNQGGNPGADGKGKGKGQQQQAGKKIKMKIKARDDAGDEEEQAKLGFSHSYISLGL